MLLKQEYFFQMENLLSVLFICSHKCMKANILLRDEIVLMDFVPFNTFATEKGNNAKSVV